MNTAETLVKESEQVLENEVLVPIILQKCAARGYEPKTQEEYAALMKIASDVRNSIASGELSPVPMQYLESDGNLSKAASVAINKDPLAFGDDFNIDLDQVSPHVKEAAAVTTWAGLEYVASQNSDDEAAK
jgi:hypothetical protein